MQPAGPQLLRPLLDLEAPASAACSRHDTCMLMHQRRIQQLEQEVAALRAQQHGPAAGPLLTSSSDYRCQGEQDTAPVAEQQDQYFGRCWCCSTHTLHSIAGCCDMLGRHGWLVCILFALPTFVLCCLGAVHYAQLMARHNTEALAHITAISQGYLFGTCHVSFSYTVHAGISSRIIKVAEPAWRQPAVSALWCLWPGCTVHHTRLQLLFAQMADGCSDDVVGAELPVCHCHNKPESSMIGMCTGWTYEQAEEYYRFCVQGLLLAMACPTLLVVCWLTRALLQWPPVAGRR